MNFIKIFPFILLINLFFYNWSFSQDTTQTDPVFVVVEEAPEFPGGQEAMMKYLIDNIKLEDLNPMESIPLTLYLSFVIDIDGSVTDVKILRSSTNSTLDQEGVAAVKSMPKWKPGKQDGKEVKVGFTIPIKVHPQ
jgi:TonB family protein